PAGRHISACDVDPEAEAIARPHIEASPYADRIEIRMGPALDTVAGLEGPFDLVFIDADKVNYRNYYEAVLPKLADRGLIAVDNVLWDGRVLGGGDDENTKAIVELKDHAGADERM